MKYRDSDTKTIMATQKTGIITEGNFFKILKLDLSYSSQSNSVAMSEEEIYGSQTIEATLTVPPRSTLTRWQPVANVAGTEIDYNCYIDTLNDTDSTPHINVRAKVLVQRRINYGHTRIRIKHFDRGVYNSCSERKLASSNSRIQFPLSIYTISRQVGN